MTKGGPHAPDGSERSDYSLVSTDNFAGTGPSADGRCGRVVKFAAMRRVPFSIRMMQVLLAVLVGGWAVRAEAQRVARCGAAERVRAVQFRGSPAFDDLTMAATIVTSEPGLLTRWLHIGTPPCLDSLEVRRDALRLAILHRQAGWFQASVLPRVDRKRDGVRVRFEITPGAELAIDSLHVQGLPAVAEGRRPFDAPLRALQGKRLDRTRLDTTVTAVLTRLRDAGYARARLTDSRIRIDSLMAKATVELSIDAGHVTRIGAVQVRIQPLTAGHAQVDSADVASLVDIDPGDRFRASRLLEAQQTLYRSEAFRLVLLDTLTPARGADSVLDLRVSVAEAKTRSARVGLGWATQDCLRAQGRINDRGFFGVGRRVELSVRASKLGLGAPADFAPGLCSPALRRDTLSAKVNYYIGTTFTTARLFRRDIVPLISLYSERRSEPFAYLRETEIGSLAELSQRFTPRTTFTAGFQYENGKTITDPAVSCTRFGLCRPEDVALSLFGRGIGIASVSATHDHSDDATNPTRGWRLRAEQRLGKTSSSFDNFLFSRSTGEASAYGRLFRGVLAVRVQSAGVFAPGASLVDGTPLIPQQERLFVGGQNSVRGYQQNLLGPVIYVVSDVNTTTNPDGSAGVVVNAGARPLRQVPRGGTAMLVGNLEWRRSFRVISSQAQFVAFLDAGTLWESRGQAFHMGDLRTTPGLGVRVITPLGPFRVDVGYRPYAALAGRALYFGPAGSDFAGDILCASPRTQAGADYSDPLTCPATYRPPETRSLLSRLVFHFGLGQAF